MSLRYKIPAVIFAGGKSTRMKTDKALLPFRGYDSLSEYQYDRLSKLFSHVYLSTKENKFNFDCKIIKDCYDISSPLVGIVSTFESIPDTHIFILSVDAPLVTPLVIQSLYGAHVLSPSCNAIIAKSSQGLQPLCGIYHKNILPIAKKQLENNDNKLKNLLSMSTYKTIYFEEDEPFTNLNTPSQYRCVL